MDASRVVTGPPDQVKASELRREPIERRELRISIECGESDTTNGLGSCPTVAQVVDRHVRDGGTVIVGETSELTGGEQLIAARRLYRSA